MVLDLAQYQWHRITYNYQSWHLGKPETLCRPVRQGQNIPALRWVRKARSPESDSSTTNLPEKETTTVSPWRKSYSPHYHNHGTKSLAPCQARHFPPRNTRIKHQQGSALKNGTSNSPLKEFWQYLGWAQTGPGRQACLGLSLEFILKV